MKSIFILLLIIFNLQLCISQKNWIKINFAENGFNQIDSSSENLSFLNIRISPEVISNKKIQIDSWTKFYYKLGDDLNWKTDLNTTNWKASKTYISSIDSTIKTTEYSHKEFLPLNQGKIWYLFPIKIPLINSENLCLWIFKHVQHLKLI